MFVIPSAARDLGFAAPDAKASIRHSARDDRLRLRSLTSQHSANAAHNAAHGKCAFIVRKKYLPNTAAAIVPALEHCEMFHDFDCRHRFHWLKRVENRLHTRFHRLRFCVLRGLDAEDRWAVDHSTVDPKKVDRIREMTGLNDQSGKAVQAANDFGELTQDRFQLFQSCVNGGSLLECEIRRCGIALRRKFAGRDSPPESK